MNIQKNIDKINVKGKGPTLSYLRFWFFLLNRIYNYEPLLWSEKSIVCYIYSTCSNLYEHSIWLKKQYYLNYALFLFYSSHLISDVSKVCVAGSLVYCEHLCGPLFVFFLLINVDLKFVTNWINGEINKFMKGMFDNYFNIIEKVLVFAYYQ
jgi:hypothetical protein